MDDWKIETRIVRLSQLPKGTVANIHWSLPRRTATIKVLDPIDSTLPKSEIVRDTELSVVHELVHLSMAKLPLDSNNTELEEETVKKLSSALCWHWTKPKQPKQCSLQRFRHLREGSRLIRDPSLSARPDARRKTVPARYMGSACRVPEYRRAGRSLSFRTRQPRDCFGP